MLLPRMSANDKRVATMRVLLLEDDEQFQEAVSLYLRDHGYDVVGVSNGVDGIRELMKAEFDAVICDMQMPTLPGNMFYLAVQRMQPELCSRFVFVSGHNDAQTDGFIEQIKGTILRKPVQMNVLADVLAFVQVRALLAPEPA